MIFERKNISRSISILRRNKRNKDKEIPRAGWKNVNQEDNNNNKIRRRRDRGFFSRDNSANSVSPFLGKLGGLVHRIRNQWNSRNMPDTRPNTNERTQISPPIPRGIFSLSLPLPSQGGKGQSRCSLNGKKAGKQHKVAVVHLHMVYRSMGVKDETGGGPWTVAIFPREYRTRIEKRALFHSSRFSQILGIASKLWNCVRLFSFFSFASFGELDPSFEAFEDLILVEWWKKWKFFWEWVEKENCQVER